MRFAREEIFGPVVTVIPYDTEEDAIALANDSDYGLGGAVYSADPERALAVARRIDSGYISVNRYGIGPRAPFGGVKRSGIGRESGIEGYDSFLEYVSHPLEHHHAVALSKLIPLASRLSPALTAEAGQCSLLTVVRCRTDAVQERVRPAAPAR